MEAFAYYAVTMDESAVQVLSLFITFVGGWIASLTTNFEFKLSRAAYFLSCGFVVFLGSATSLFLLSLQNALRHEYLVVIVLLIYGSLLPVGFIAGIFSASRSRDAYGDSSKWFYAFVPFANLALLFKASQSGERAEAVRYFRNFGLVAAGFVLFLIGAGISMGVTKVVTKSATNALNDPAYVEKVTKYEIANKGVESILNEAAKAVTVPAKVDDTTTLTGVDVEIDTLRYIYTISEKNATFSGSWHDVMMNRWCKDEGFVRFMRIGATLEGSYVDQRGNQLAAVKVNSVLCEDWRQQFRLLMENMARSVKGPQKIDDVTTLQNATYADHVFTYNYTLNQQILDMVAFMEYFKMKICNENFGFMYQTDTTVRFVYHSLDGDVIAEVNGNKERCIPD